MLTSRVYKKFTLNGSENAAARLVSSNTAHLHHVRNKPCSLFAAVCCVGTVVPKLPSCNQQEHWFLSVTEAAAPCTTQLKL